MQQLIERLGKLSGPDRECDVRIWLALFDKQIIVDGGGYRPNQRPVKYESARKLWDDTWPYWSEKHQVEGVALELGCPLYTGSIDAALTLVLPNSAWAVSHSPDAKDDYPKGYRATVMPPRGSGGGDATEHAATPAIALVVACLKSRQSSRAAEK
jgi:hypothetical protein